MRHNTEHSPFGALDTVILSRPTPLQPTATLSQVDIVANTTLLKAAPKTLADTSMSALCAQKCILPDSVGDLRSPMTPQVLPTPVKIDKLLRWLEGYDKIKTKYLEIGFLEGFRLGFNGVLNKKQPPNLKSALDLPEVTKEKIIKEIRANRVEGPFDLPPKSNLHISIIGLQPKKVEGEYRLIHHLSYPEGLSVNDGIDQTYKSVQYQSIDDAISAIKWLGKGCYMAKTDIKSAFRLIPVHPSDHYLLGFCWQEQYYFDKCLPMGCSSSCKIFEEVSCALQWVACHGWQLGIPAVIHVLDDFLFLAPSKSMAFVSLQKFLCLCQEVGIPIANEKTEGPARTLTFLGIELDSIMMQASLASEKVQRCIELINPLIQQKKVKLKELQSIIGTLNFACSVVRPGRTFLRINLTIGVSKPFHHIRVNKEVKADLS